MLKTALTIFIILLIATEKKFVAMLKELRSYRMTTKILDAIDPDTWSEG